MNVNLNSNLRFLLAGQSMTRREAERTLSRVLDHALPPEQLGAFFYGLRAKQESAEEIAGFLDCLEKRAIPIPAVATHRPLMDICGTGGDGAGTFNISTVVAFVLAAAGQPVAKHGNRAVSSQSGSFDVLEKLGVRTESDPAQAVVQIHDVGLAFLFAPAFHPALATLAQMRRNLGFHSVLNTLGPLLNPAPIRRQLIGVSSADLQQKIAEAMRDRGMEEVMIVQGDGGSGQLLDEISISSQTRVVHLKYGEIITYSLCPEDFGLTRAPLESICGGSATDNARILTEILQGKKGPQRDIVLMNTAAALHVGGLATTLLDGVRIAAEAVDSGRAYKLLRTMQGASSLQVLGQVLGVPQSTILEKISVDVQKRLDERRRTRATVSILDLDRRPLREFPSGLIAEVKYASPSQGKLADRTQSSPVAIAGEYLRNGAAALSVLTEQDHFSGRIADLVAIRQAFPDAFILMKDFVIDEYQLFEAREAGADAVLLIIALFGKARVAQLLERCRELNLHALVEVHDEVEMRIAIEIGAQVIGVNNRNLKTFVVSLDTSRRLASYFACHLDSLVSSCALPQVKLISESGISTQDEMNELGRLGYSGFLVGTALSLGRFRPSPGLLKVKICGLTRAQDAESAICMGAWALGFNFYPKSPRYVSPTRVREMIARITTRTTQATGQVKKVGVFVNQDLAQIQCIVETSGVDTVQLHGTQTPEFCARLRERLPQVSQIKALRLRTVDDFTLLPQYRAVCDSILLDTYLPHAPSTYGGSGVSGDWDLAKFAAQSGPIILAGGLNSTNIRAALQKLGPGTLAAIDVCSGVELEPGVKSYAKMKQFMRYSHA